MNEIQDSHHAMHVESGCSRQWFHDGPCAPQDDREAEVARIAAVLRPMSDDLDLTGYPWDEQSPQGWRHKRLAAALYDAGLRSPQAPESPTYIEVRSTACRAGSDGDCSWAGCPQVRDGEPVKSGRHCPLDHQAPESPETLP